MHSNDNLPYLLNDDTQKFIESYDCCIKHHISFPLIKDKLDNNQYFSFDEFRNDINLMWRNMEIYFGDNSDVTRLANLIENDV